MTPQAQMQGHLTSDGIMLQRGGFLHPHLGNGFTPGPSTPIISRGLSIDPTKDFSDMVGQIERGEITGDMNQILSKLSMTLGEFQRGITSGMTAFPVRENLEAEAKILVPLDTPLRNKLPRSLGSGLSSAWKQATSLGGGYGTSIDQPGGVGNTQMFFAESGAPVAHTTVYANKSVSYKLLGTFGSVTGLAMAAGANFMNQLATEKRNAILNLMLNEEYALTSGDSTSTAAPWGDGGTALSFDGLTNLITTGNGVPSAQVQTTVGALTTTHLDTQLKRLWVQGGQRPYILMNGQEILSLTALAMANGSILRVVTESTAEGILGFTVRGYKHPITGEIVEIVPSRFLAAGTILFCSQALPDGTPAADVQVLPQVQLPELAPNDNVQGYVAQELAPTTAAPQVYPFIVTVYEVLRMKGATVFGKSTGVTQVG